MAGGKCWDKARVRGDCSGSSYCARPMVGCRGSGHASPGPLAQHAGSGGVGPRGSISLRRRPQHLYRRTRPGPLHVKRGYMPVNKDMALCHGGVRQASTRSRIFEMESPLQYFAHARASGLRDRESGGWGRCRTVPPVDRSWDRPPLLRSRRGTDPKLGCPGEQANIFFRFWPLKEAFIKATGEGLSRPLDSFSFSFEPVRIAFHPERNNRPGRDDPAEWRFWEWYLANDCVAALAVRSRSTDMSAIRLDAGPARATDIGPL